MYIPTGIEHRSRRQGLLPVSDPPPHEDAQARLQALTARVHHDLETLIYPKDAWVLPRQHASGAHVYDVVIVGGGQCGMTIAFGLQRERVTNILVLDGAPRGREGPWVTYSRMWTLRSPKHVTGPDLGMPSLAPRSWYEAFFGEAAWDKLDKWPRRTWQAYLDWYRDALRLPVRNDAMVERFRQEGDLVAVNVRGGEVVLARKVILATGLEGIGGWRVPDIVTSSLPRSAWTLCTDDVDSLHWRGQRIAVLGAGATAWDRAADLLELGAHSVTIYMRRNKVLAANPFRYLEKAGYLRHYQSMDDAGKWRWIRTILSFGQPPTQDGVDRCATFENFTLHAGCSWAALSQTDSGIEVTGTDGSVELFDHLFIGCGFSMDASGRPELAELAPNILTWADVYTPPAEYQDDWLQTYPYLDKSLRFMEREPGATPVLRNLFCFNYGALVSNAHSGASLSGILYGLPTLIHGVTGALWAEDEPEHFRMTKSWQAIDTDPGKLAQRLWKPASSR
jgi:cation diffusion facilitator CzcD-associated flavoprotein CzcO